jgi:hypothetical protein
VKHSEDEVVFHIEDNGTSLFLFKPFPPFSIARGNTMTVWPTVKSILESHSPIDSIVKFIKRRGLEMSDDKAKSGRINSHYSMCTVNEEGVKTIEANVIIRDQSFEGASAQLLGVLDGLTSPAKAQVS